MADKIDLTLSKVTVEIASQKGGVDVARPEKKARQRLGLSIDRTNWTDDTQRLKVALLASFDNGKSWVEWCAYEDQGGEQLGPNGEILASSTFVATPPPDGAILQVQRTVLKGKDIAQAIAFVEAL